MGLNACIGGNRLLTLLWRTQNILTHGFLLHSTKRSLTNEQKSTLSPQRINLLRFQRGGVAWLPVLRVNIPMPICISRQQKRMLHQKEQPASII